MSNSDDRIKMLKEDMERIRKEKPHVQTLLDAFMPMILNEKIMTDQIAAKGVTLSPDKLKVMGGIPLIEGNHLFSDDDPMQEIALSVSSAIREGCPHLAEELDRLTILLQQHAGELVELFLPSAAPAVEEIPAWEADTPINPAVQALLLNSVRRIVLSRRAQDLAETTADLPWDKGYCPVCGSFPMLSFIRENGQRWLHCACCHHEWTYPRLKCPCCEQETPENTTYLFVDGDDENSAYFCEKCRKYLITVKNTEKLREMDADLTSISLAHLDVILQGKGFSPMAGREWNVLDQ